MTIETLAVPGLPASNIAEFYAFLDARITEDEAVARRAQRHYQHVFGIPHWFTANSDTSVAMNPRVALAECASKRRIIQVNTERQRKPSTPAFGWTSVPDGEQRWRAAIVVFGEHGDIVLDAAASREFADTWYELAPPNTTLRLLAAPYADRPDFNEAWRV